MWSCPVCGSMEFIITPNGGKMQKIRCTACERTFVLEEPISLGGYCKNW